VRTASLAAAAAIAALAIAHPAAAGAEPVSSAELAQLAERAPDDAVARERLLAVDRVDGRRVAVRDALAGARGEELARRGRAIAESVRAAGDSPSPAAAREQTREVLADRRFRGSDVPRPLAGVFEWIGDRIDPVLGWIDDAGRDLPGGPIALWTVLAAACLLAATAITSVSIRRRALAIARARAAALPATEDPRALEREAERAERDGQWERAVRLRFRAGLLRLDRRRVIAYRPSLTTGEVAQAVESPAFAEVGARFDAIAYGGREARREDAEAARRGWEAVLAEAAPR
jgi:hypothetical protein